LEPLEDRSLLAPMADIVNVVPDPRATPVGQVFIDFDRLVTGVDISDFTLTLEGEIVPIDHLPVAGSGDSYSINLSDVTLVSGTYVLTLVATDSGITDGSGDLLLENAMDNWVIDQSSPVADIIDISPDPRNTAVGNVTISFNEPVTGVDIADFVLRRDGVDVPLAGLQVNGSGSIYTLNLSSVTEVTGAYELKLVAASSGIRDVVENSLTADASDTWSADTTAPTAEIIAIAPDPRTTAVGAVSIVITEPVTGVNITDFTLTRNGTAVSLTGLAVSGSGQNYSLNLSTVTVAAGTYVLTLVAAGSGITDSHGNALAASVSDTWVNDTTAPTPDIVDIAPDPRTTPVGNVTINFSEPVMGVDINDFRLTRNGAAVSLAGLVVGGSGASYTLNLSTVTTTFGNYVLTLVASGSGIIDVAGNMLLANASDSWFVDDAFEQNDTLRTAKELGRLTSPLTIGPLGLVDGNDWYRFTTTKKGGASNKVSIAFQNAQGNLDLELYSVSGRLLKSSKGNANGESVSLNGLAAGTYYIRVFGRAGAANANYSLTINAPQAAAAKQAQVNAAAVDALLANSMSSTTKRRSR